MGCDIYFILFIYLFIIICHGLTIADNRKNKLEVGGELKQGMGKEDAKLDVIKNSIIEKMMGTTL